MTMWKSTCNPCFSTFEQIFFCVSWIKKLGFFCYSLKLNFICYLNRFFTFDYSLWDGGDIRFCGQKQTLILICYYICILIVYMNICEVSIFIPPANKVWGVYRNHPVCPSVYVPCKRNSS